MQKPGKTQLAVWLTFVMTVVVTVLRVVLIPLSQDVDTGLFHISYVVIGVTLLAWIISAALLWCGRKTLPVLPPVTGAWAKPLAAVMMAVGGCILVASLWDIYRWAAWGITPPPMRTTISTVDGITLVLSLVFSVLTGIYLLRLGWLWWKNRGSTMAPMPFWALCPTIWIWMRLARYEVSYASAVEVHESFYDFVMLLFMLLFLFQLARHTAAVGETRPLRLLFFGCGTALMALSGPVSRVIFYLMEEGDAYRVGQLAGISDFAIGILAAVMCLYWVSVKPSSEPEKSEEKIPVSMLMDSLEPFTEDPSAEN